VGGGERFEHSGERSGNVEERSGTLGRGRLLMLEQRGEHSVTVEQWEVVNVGT
jgi:hypothetical protein